MTQVQKEADEREPRLRGEASEGNVLGPRVSPDTGGNLHGSGRDPWPSDLVSHD